MAEVLRSQGDLIDRIREFGKLRPGWNSFRAPEISSSAIKTALDVVYTATRRGAPMPSAAPTAQGGIALTWYLPDIEIQLLVDDESLDYSVARPGSPKVLDQGSFADVIGVERGLIDQYL